MTAFKHETASDYFGSIVESYDSLIRRAVPRYDEMTARLIEYLPQNATRVLELGCGSGNLSLRLAARYPQAALTFVDASREMTDITRTRLAVSHPDAIDRARFITAPFEEIDLAPQSFDVVTSCISLHHVHDKATLYQRLHNAMPPGATFRFADQIRGSTAFNHDVNWQSWLEFCRRPGHCTETEIQDLLDHAAAHDHYTPLREHFQLLEAAGFANVDCVWRNLIWGIVTAERA